MVGAGRRHGFTSISSGTRLDSDVADDVVLPSQFYPLARPACGEIDLCRAILAQAVEDYTRLPNHVHPTRRACGVCLDRDDAELFFMGVNNSTFDWVCSVLKLDPQAVWRAVQRLTSFACPRFHPTHKGCRINGKARHLAP